MMCLLASQAALGVQLGSMLMSAVQAVQPVKYANMTLQEDAIKATNAQQNYPQAVPLQTESQQATT